MKAATACPAGRLRAALYGQPAHDATALCDGRRRREAGRRLPVRPSFVAAGLAPLSLARRSTRMKVIHEDAAVTGNSSAELLGFIDTITPDMFEMNRLPYRSRNEKSTPSRTFVAVAYGLRPCARSPIGSYRRYRTRLGLLCDSSTESDTRRLQRAI